MGRAKFETLTVWPSHPIEEVRKLPRLMPSSNLPEQNQRGTASPNATGRDLRGRVQMLVGIAMKAAGIVRISAAVALTASFAKR